MTISCTRPSGPSQLAVSNNRNTVLCNTILPSDCFSGYPSGEPQCYANATLDSESLLLSCSWEGGLPSALLWWTSDSGDTLKEEESTNNLMLPSNITHHIRSFTCHAQHPLLPERRECVLQLGENLSPLLVEGRSFVKNC